MLQISEFFTALFSHGVGSYFGVPDSLLKGFCAYLADKKDEIHHIIAANEGNAVALAAGSYLATSSIAVVYMQNSGIGNAINPLLSLTDADVYNIPLLLIIGWRGEPGTTDEPQHVKQGKITEDLLKAIDIKHEILPLTFEDAEECINNAFSYMQRTKQPYALLVRNNTFFPYKMQMNVPNAYQLGREDSIACVLERLRDDDVVVSTTGQISREIYEYREKKSQPHRQDFLSVGSMGHASSVALSIAAKMQHRNIFCFDGDGSLLMHMGSLPVIAAQHLTNYKHILFNNEAHDSVGGQPTVANSVNFTAFAKTCGISNTYLVDSPEMLEGVLDSFLKCRGMAFLEIKVKRGARSDLGRPKTTPIENKTELMRFLNPQTTFIYRNSMKNLSALLECNKADKLLIFRGQNSFEKIRHFIAPQLCGMDLAEYSNFSINPKYEDIEKAVKQHGYNHYDAIIAIGGGSVIDFAKAYKWYSGVKIPLIAIPTTAGTGSEATQFAVIYRDGKKYSLDDLSLLPEFAIIDSRLVMQASAYIKACTAMDTFCQSIESFWSVKSTEESRFYAKHSILLCKNDLESFVLTSEPAFADNMVMSANLSGRAINISRTTAAHALSYTITTKYNIPHGHAVALSIAGLFKLNLNVNNQNCQDTRGLAYVKSRMEELLNILELNPDEISVYFQSLMDRIGLNWRLHELNIQNIDEIISTVDAQRLSNNPVDITQNIKLVWL